MTQIRQSLSIQQIERWSDSYSNAHYMESLGQFGLQSAANVQVFLNSLTGKEIQKRIIDLFLAMESIEREMSDEHYLKAYRHLLLSALLMAAASEHSDDLKDYLRLLEEAVQKRLKINQSSHFIESKPAVLPILELARNIEVINLNQKQVELEDLIKSLNDIDNELGLVERTTQDLDDTHDEINEHLNALEQARNNLQPNRLALRHLHQQVNVKLQAYASTPSTQHPVTQTGLRLREAHFQLLMEILNEEMAALPTPTPRPTPASRIALLVAEQEKKIAEYKQQLLQKREKTLEKIETTKNRMFHLERTYHHSLNDALPGNRHEFNKQTIDGLFMHGLFQTPRPTFEDNQDLQEKLFKNRQKKFR